jgi:hypothetical protein
LLGDGNGEGEEPSGREEVSALATFPRGRLGSAFPTPGDLTDAEVAESLALRLCVPEEEEDGALLVAGREEEVGPKTSTPGVGSACLIVVSSNRGLPFDSAFVESVMFAS